jgi:DNA-binding response OmpR family regulator
MVVNDDMTMRFLVAEALERTGFRVEEVEAQ